MWYGACASSGCRIMEYIMVGPLEMTVYSIQKLDVPSFEKIENINAVKN